MTHTAIPMVLMFGACPKNTIEKNIRLHVSLQFHVKFCTPDIFWESERKFVKLTKKRCCIVVTQFYKKFVFSFFGNFSVQIHRLKENFKKSSNQPLHNIYRNPNLNNPFQNKPFRILLDAKSSELIFQTYQIMIKILCKRIDFF